MEIEYQNKYVVTWCLDRDGPRICFRAVTKENQLRTFEIISEDFILEFDYEEARDFLNLLSQLAAAGSMKHVKPVPVYKASTIEEDHLLKAEDDLSPEVMLETIESNVPEAMPEVVVSETSETITTEDSEVITSEVPDSSEIIQILKKSEQTYSEITPSSLDDVSIEDQTPIPPENETESIQEEPIVSESLPLQEILEVSPTEIETASFFQKSESKSPLEMLLDEDKKNKEIEGAIDSSQVSEHEIEETPKSTPETKIAYTPNDLQTDAFFSKFDAKDIVDLMQQPEAVSEPEPEPEPEPKPEFKRAVSLSPAPKFVKQEPITTEAERRAVIEKERADRRKRLWELTRGF